MTHDDEWLPLKQAAELAGCSPAVLRRAIQRGEVQGRQAGGPRGQGWQVLRMSLPGTPRPADLARRSTSVVEVVEQRPPQQDYSPVMIELVHLVHDLTARNEALVYESAELRADLRLAQERIRRLETERRSPSA